MFSTLTTDVFSFHLGERALCLFDHMSVVEVEIEAYWMKEQCQE